MNPTPTPTAFVISKDSYHVIVMCPYCYIPHRHGSQATVVGSHCENQALKGDYIIGGDPDWTIIGHALRDRAREVKRRRESRQKLKNDKNKI